MRRRTAKQGTNEKLSFGLGLKRSGKMHSARYEYDVSLLQTHFLLEPMLECRSVTKCVAFFCKETYSFTPGVGLFWVKIHCPPVCFLGVLCTVRPVTDMAFVSVSKGLSVWSWPLSIKTYTRNEFPFTVNVWLKYSAEVWRRGQVNHSMNNVPYFPILSSSSCLLNARKQVLSATKSFLSFPFPFFPPPPFFKKSDESSE